MTDAQLADELFARWNPHFTPRWLSENLVEQLPQTFVGTVVDPACGSGNLLAAAALRLREREGNHFVGVDKDARALATCKSALGRLLPPSAVSLKKSDFLGLRAIATKAAHSAVVMNPPFMGYGVMEEGFRRELAKKFQLRGRFNLAHAFVLAALRLVDPDILVALLPSNWYYSKVSDFRRRLDSIPGSWAWRDVGADVFGRVSTHVGVLTWSRDRVRFKRDVERRPEGLVLGHINGLEVRNGVATGRDHAYIELSAQAALRLGRRALAARGRDVERPTKVPIWVPPHRPSTRQVETLVRTIPSNIRHQLSKRSCVREGDRDWFSYHDAVPEWFFGTPKLLLPEVVTRGVRVEIDDNGEVLPLHSCIAVRLPSPESAAILRDELSSHEAMKYFESTAPRLEGGALRLTAAILKGLPLSERTFRYLAGAFNIAAAA